jgi:lipopolysaccharide export system permease protein
LILITDKIITLNCNLRNLHNLYKELYKRIIVPTYLPLLVIISLILVIKSKESTNYLNYRIFIFLLGLLTIIFSEATIKLISDDLIKNINIFILPLMIFLIFYLSIFYNLRHKYKI